MAREIFRMFLEKRSLVAVAQELTRRGWALKRWTTKNGRAVGGGRFSKVNLRRLLTNYTYIGKVNFQGKVYDGEHEGIVSAKVFREVQAALAENKRGGNAVHRNQHGALLRGLLRCAACDRAMVHHWTRHDGRLYRYYTCQRAQKEGAAACPSKSVSADKVERFVVGQIKRIGGSPELQAATFTQAVAELKAQRRGLRLEGKRIQAELATARPEVERLVGAVTRTAGSVADAIASELGKTQERIASLEARLAEAETQVAALKAQDIDPADLARALEAFDPIWEVLLTPERERVLRLLIDRIDSQGASGELKIHWRIAGLVDFATEVNGSTP